MEDELKSLQDLEINGMLLWSQWGTKISKLFYEELCNVCIFLTVDGVTSNSSVHGIVLDEIIFVFHYTVGCIDSLCGEVGLAHGLRCLSLHDSSQNVQKKQRRANDFCFFSYTVGTTSLRCPEWTRDSNMSEVLLNNNCYVLVKNQASWSEAKSFCESHGYGLVSFQDSTKQRIVEEWLITSLSRPTCVSYWTSGFRKRGDPVTVWFWNYKGSGNNFWSQIFSNYQ